MPRTPIALDETPPSRDVDGIPGISETRICKFYPRLIPRRFAEPFNDHAVKAGVGAETLKKDVVTFSSLFNASQES